MFTFESKGSFDSTEAWLKGLAAGDVFSQLEKFGDEGVRALAAATPQDSGRTASSWYYEIIKESDSWSIVWGNTYVEDGRPIAILLQYGHATRTGGYVQGRDYINPALQSVFDRLAAEAWKAVKSA